MKKFYTVLLSFIFLFYLTNISYGWGEPQIVKTLTKAFENIQSWLLTLATPAAAVAVVTGAFMKKFSFGDEEKIRMGKKLIKGSLFSYGLILCINLILSAIESLLG